eukprot:GHVQ01038993.1.p1 GENE.GHVQ01038993.1~~GHVQ01038993.1.p1  ORF type:complete len:655 (+),score=59.98 GHVQ01038993.1:2443-4407(+)
MAKSVVGQRKIRLLLCTLVIVLTTVLGYNRIHANDILRTSCCYGIDMESSSGCQLLNRVRTPSVSGFCHFSVSRVAVRHFDSTTHQETPTACSIATRSSPSLLYFSISYSSCTNLPRLDYPTRLYVKGRGATKSRKFSNRKRFCRLGPGPGCLPHLLNKRRSATFPPQYRDRSKDVDLAINVPNRLHLTNARPRPVNPACDLSLVKAIPRISSLPPFVDPYTNDDLRTIGFPIAGLNDSQTLPLNAYIRSSRSFTRKEKVAQFMQRLRHIKDNLVKSDPSAQLAKNVSVAVSVGSRLFRGPEYTDSPSRYPSKTDGRTYRAECHGHKPTNYFVPSHLRVGREEQSTCSDTSDGEAVDDHDIGLPVDYVDPYADVDELGHKRSTGMNHGIFYTFGIDGIRHGGYDDLDGTEGDGIGAQRAGIRRTVSLMGRESPGVGLSCFDGRHPLDGAYDRRYADDWRRFKEVLQAEKEGGDPKREVKRVKMIRGPYRGVPLEVIVKEMNSDRNPYLKRRKKGKLKHRSYVHYSVDPEKPERCNDWYKEMKKWNKDNPDKQQFNVDLYKFDLIFCDRLGRIVHMKENSPPYNFEFAPPPEMDGHEPFYILQLAKGYIETRGPQVGEVCEFVNDEQRRVYYENHFAKTRRSRWPLLLPDGRVIR